VYDVVGRKVASIANGTFAPGFYQADWDARDDVFTSGLYTYRLVAVSKNSKEVRSGKLLLNK
jgi:hypothetical protein